MSKLVCVRGSNKGDEYPLPEGVTVIGRTGECSITLFDKKCSRAHCEIHKKGTYYAIEDLQSRNGTHVNGKKLKKSKSLKIGDQIRIGRTLLELSDKPVGNLLTQTATDVAADLQGSQFNKLFGSAAAEAARVQTEHENSTFAPIKQFFKKFLGGK